MVFILEQVLVNSLRIGLAIAMVISTTARAADFQVVTEPGKSGIKSGDSFFQVGGPAEELKKKLGDPDAVVANNVTGGSNLKYYRNGLSVGVEADRISKFELSVVRSPPMFAANVLTDKGIMAGAKRADVLAAHGNPESVKNEDVIGFFYLNYAWGHFLFERGELTLIVVSK